MRRTKSSKRLPQALFLEKGYRAQFPRRGFIRPYPGAMKRPAQRIKSDTLTARPAVFGKTGRRSFFVDQTRVIRFTSENRLATASDPEIPAGSLPPLS
jgi:hypothetical protein